MNQSFWNSTKQQSHTKKLQIFSYDFVVLFAHLKNTKIISFEIILVFFKCAAFNFLKGYFVIFNLTKLFICRLNYKSHSLYYFFILKSQRIVDLFFDFSITLVFYYFLYFILYLLKFFYPFF